MKRCLLILLILVVAISLSALKKPEKATEYRLYIVQEGDTLWDISAEITPGSRDIRDTMGEIEEKNELKGGFIYGGQRLQVPVYEEK